MNWKEIKDQVVASLGEVFNLFFRSETGRHHGGYPLGNRIEASNLLVAFTPLVPHIQMTDQLDRMVAEAKHGRILYPVVSEKRSPKANKAWQKLTLPSGPQALDQTLKTYQNTLKEYAGYQKRQHRDPELAQQIRAALVLRELKLRALAAQRDLNLYGLGYEPSPLATGETFNHNRDQNHGLGLGLDLSLWL